MFNPPIDSPCWIELSSPEPQIAQDFYGELFGWEFTEPGPLGLGTKCHLDGQAVAGISPQPEQAPAGQPAFWSVYLRSADLGALLEKTSDAGGQAMMAIPEFDGTAGVAIIADPAGTAFGVLEYDDDRAFTGFDRPGAPSWFELHTKQTAVSEFYESVFGWTFTAQTDSDGTPFTTFGAGAGPFGGLIDTSQIDIPAHWECHIRVDDVEATAEAVQRLGGDLLTPLHRTAQGRVGRFIDRQNAAFTVVQPAV